jgi:hypothetical protein
VRDHGSGSAELVPAAAVFGAEVWDNRKIYRPLLQMDCDPEQVVTYVMPAMEMALIYLAHRRGNFQPRALVSLLGLCSRLPFPVSLPDPADDVKLQQSAMEVLASGTPAFTKSSGKNRQRWILWRNDGYFSSTDIGDEHNGGRRKYLSALKMKEVPVMTKVKDAPTLFEDMKRILTNYTKTGFRTKAENDQAKRLKGSGRQRRIWFFRHEEVMTRDSFQDLIETESYDETCVQWMLEVFMNIRHCNGFATPHSPPSPAEERAAAASRSSPPSPAEERPAAASRSSPPSPAEERPAAASRSSPSPPVAPECMEIVDLWTD